MGTSCNSVKLNTASHTGECQLDLALRPLTRKPQISYSGFGGKVTLVSTREIVGRRFSLFIHPSDLYFFHDFQDKSNKC